jgi:hypothetical protein
MLGNLLAMFLASVHRHDMARILPSAAGGGMFEVTSLFLGEACLKCSRSIACLALQSLASVSDPGFQEG